VHIASARLNVEPAASVRWYRDIYGNSIAILTFTDPAETRSEHISVAVAREQDKASPLSGSWRGASDAFAEMDVSVQVVAL
jgi:hypothetical protein